MNRMSPPSSRTGPSSTSSAGTILVADDEANTRVLLAGSLKRWGYDVVTAEDGGVALEKLSNPAIRIVVCDWEMPELDGPSLCAYVRGRGGPHIYFMLLTHHSDADSVRRGLDAGADDYLAKPFDPLELRMRLDVGKRILALHDELAAKKVEVARLTARLAERDRTPPSSKGTR